MAALTRQTLHGRTAFGLLVLVILMAAGALDALTTMAQHRDAEAVERARDAIEALQEFATDLGQARVAMRGRIETGSSEDLSAFNERLRLAATTLDAFERVAQDPQRSAAALRLREDLVGLHRLWSQALALGPAGSHLTPADPARDLELLQATYAEVAQTQSAQRGALERQRAALRRAYLSSLWSGIASTAIALAAIALYMVAGARRERALARSAARLAELAEELRIRDRRKDAFLATLAHELRSPLSPIKNASEILSLGAPSEERAKHLAGMLARQASHMTTLVNDLLDSARVAHGKLVLRRETSRLSAILDTAVEASAPGMQANGHTLEILRPNQDAQIDVDPLRLAQVLTNLLNNAARYTPAGGHAWLEAQVSGSDLRLVVTDNGVGLSPSARERIFDMFEQGDAAECGRQGGLGIGLALAKAIVELHGGWISARSEGAGRGCEFEVYLPGIVLAAPQAEGGSCDPPQSDPTAGAK